MLIWYLYNDSNSVSCITWGVYHNAGDIERDMDPYFPFEEAVDVWARTFAGLGIQYKGARMRLDLCDRPGKYSNGFCHWPQPAWRRVPPLSTACLPPKSCRTTALLCALPGPSFYRQQCSPPFACWKMCG